MLLILEQRPKLLTIYQREQLKRYQEATNAVNR